MDPIWILVAFLFGFAVSRVKLPPLVGYLLAGFVLNFAGVEGSDVLQKVSDIGVTLLLFTIGLKLNLRSLIKPQVWAVGFVHMSVTVLLLGIIFLLLSFSGIQYFTSINFNTSLLIAFALSFSSTVFAVKVLEEKSEMNSGHGRTAIGILILQDLIAVMYIVLSSDTIPTLWALTLLGLIPLRWLLLRILERVGHGELLLLYGLFLTLGGAAFFEQVGLKADLGALVMGVLLANHPKAKELSRSLLDFKDLFLVGFFLNIGLTETPNMMSLLVALILLAAVVFKIFLYFLLLTRFRMRSRTSLLAAFSLANYSEFGLIVAAIGFSNGIISAEWLVIIAVSLALTFILASPLNTSSHIIYTKLHHWLHHFETSRRLPEDEPINAGDAQVLIFGMGAVGTAAYQTLQKKFVKTVLGVDFDPVIVNRHHENSLNVILGDATDADFWDRLQTCGVRLIVLAMPNHKENMAAIKQVKTCGFNGLIAAAARYEDQVKELEEAGAHAAFNLLHEAGSGFAEHICRTLDNNEIKSSHN